MIDRAGNLLGALSLVITDRINDANHAAAGVSGSQAAALSAMYHFLETPSVDQLRQVLGLTPSGTVRLIDRLEEDRYVTRGPGEDGRTTKLALTDSGRMAAEKVATARAETVERSLGILEPDERKVLESLMGEMLAGMVRPSGATRWMCRLCDTTACGRDQGLCPVANEALRRASRAQPD